MWFEEAVKLAREGKTVFHYSNNIYFLFENEEFHYGKCMFKDDKIDYKLFLRNYYLPDELRINLLKQFVIEQIYSDKWEVVDE